MPRLMAALAVALVVLTGCTALPGADPSAGSIDSIIVGSDDVFGVPGLEFEPGLNYSTADSRVIWEGEGDPLVHGDRLLLDIYAVSLDDGDIIQSTFEGLPQSSLVAPELLGQDLYDQILGLRPGARILHVSPATEGYLEWGPVAILIDVLPSRASGVTQPIRGDLPLVLLGPDGTPAITVRDGQEVPETLVVATLIQGAGEQIREGSWVTVHYTGIDFETGELFESSWDPGNAPWNTQVGSGLLPAGWDQGLIDRTEGSQVLLIIPPTLAYGDGTLVFVIDILAVWNQG